MTAVDPHTPETEVDVSALTAGLVESEDRRLAEASSTPEQQVLPDDLLPGVGGDPVPLRQAVQDNGLRLLLALSLLNFLEEFDRTALTILGPDIQRSLGLSDAALGVTVGLGAVVLTLAAVPLGVAADRYRRVPIAGLAGVIAAIFSVLTGAVQALWQLVLVRLAIGTGQASVLSLHNAMLSDGYPLRARGAVLGVHNASSSLARILAPVAAGGLAAAVGGAAGWRWPFVVIGALVLAAALFTFTVREPLRGRNEQLAVTGQVLDREQVQEHPIPVGAGIERLLKVQTLRFLLLGIGVLGVSLVTVPTFFFLLLEDEYGLGALERGVAGSLIEVGALVGILIGGVVGQRLFRQNPPSAIIFVAAGQAGFGLLFAVVITFDSLPLLVGGLLLANIPQGLALVPVYTFVAGVVPYRLRGLAFALIGIFIVLIGGLLGNLVVGSLSDERGPRAALLAVVPVTALIGAGLAAYGARFVRRDLSLVVQELREENAERERVEAGGEVAMLQVRNLDFSYGPVQVLFDVSIDVHRGEVLALLGTNGAGKSTLLRAITGLQLPDRGAVRLDGRNITYLEAETRVGMGIVQVPGGKAVFPALTVAENLLAGAHRFIWDRSLVEERVEASLELFPRLRERLDQAAGTLSGGEQQQLAIAKALLLDPQLLCIDELSLGLAPVVVQDILATVEQLKDRGVTMVIVEQSVNVALSIADRAIFMEKGQVKFQGPAQELLERDDLVRAVFLGGEGG